MILYRTLKRMIEKGLIEGLGEKIDIFFAARKITQAQYEELTGKLTQGGTSEVSP